MDGSELPVGALVNYGGRVMRHIGGGRFVPHEPGPQDTPPGGEPLAKRFLGNDEGPLVGGETCRD
jgi:hypothetical protein